MKWEGAALEAQELWVHPVSASNLLWCEGKVTSAQPWSNVKPHSSHWDWGSFPPSILRFCLDPGKKGQPCLDLGESNDTAQFWPRTIFWVKKENVLETGEMGSGPHWPLTQGEVGQIISPVWASVSSLKNRTLIFQIFVVILNNVLSKRNLLPIPQRDRKNKQTRTFPVEAVEKPSESIPVTLESHVIFFGTLFPHVWQGNKNSCSNGLIVNQGENETRYVKRLCKLLSCCENVQSQVQACC